LGEISEDTLFLGIGFGVKEGTFLDCSEKENLENGKKLPTSLFFGILGLGGTVFESFFRLFFFVALSTNDKPLLFLFFLCMIRIDRYISGMKKLLNSLLFLVCAGWLIHCMGGLFGREKT